MIISSAARPSSRCRSALLVAALLCGAAAMPAMAEDAATPPAAADQNEILVTAQKRPQTLLEVPSSVLALSGERLRDSGVRDFIQLSQQTPGVIVSNQLAGGRTIQTFTIRGIGYDDFRPNGSPSAAVHFDGVYEGSAALIGGQMFDVARVEVLKGPQGTLYGRNTTAGAVNVISNKPGQTVEGYANLEYGNYNSLRGEAAVNVPLNEKIAVRVSGVYDRTDGYQTNVGPGSYAGYTPNPAIPAIPQVATDDKASGTKFYAGRALMSVNLGEGTDLLFNAHGFREKGGQAQAERTLPSATLPANAPYTFDSNIVPRLDKKNYGGSATLTQEVGSAALLTVIGAYEHLDQHFDWGDGAPTRTFDINYHDTLKAGSLEARLQNKDKGRFDWVVGGAYFKDRTRMQSILDGSDAFRTIFAADYLQKRQSWATFADGSIKLGDRWKIGAGLRYTRETSEFSGSTIDLNPYGLSIASVALPGVPAIFDNHFKDGRLSGKASLSYQLSRDAQAYVSIGRGFKAGGFDGSTIFSTPEALPFKSENVWAYEGGVKFLPRGGPVQLEVSGFYYDYSNLQANTLLQPSPGVFTNIRTNVGKARIFGGEASAVIRPIERLDLRVGVSLLDSKITSIVSASAAEAARRLGNDLPNAPHMTINGSIRYEMPLNDRVSLIPYITGRFVDNYFTELDNYRTIGGYFLGDARLELNLDKRWSIAGYVRNFTNVRYSTGLGGASTTVYNVFRGAPRTYGASVGVKF
ncbi:TonB-dependent receptor [Sphingomonas sp. AP4-R1]|uniref:TonB-dependent receptor n=1 Tax=Sphingomonas sp. AP4-R1 TaxID=2735134 RepID=UPI0014937D54|nr:TonB-dependent receptor [Sphingomonas sp. AP4-R1]QJU58874.1 TonB-dependent receptor [Sphingomonas sp. AP4-R1]